MSHPCQSLTPVRKGLAHSAALTCVASILKERQERREAAIQEAMEPRPRLFREPLPGRTREEAAAYVDHPRDFPPDWSYLWWGDLDRAKKIIAACSLAHGDTIYLTLDDAEFIKRNLTKATTQEILHDAALAS